MNEPVPTKKIVIHHTATTNSYTDGAAQVRAVYAYQAGTRSWGDVGYHVLVDRYGRIYEGRQGRVLSLVTPMRSG